MARMQHDEQLPSETSTARAGKSPKVRYERQLVPLHFPVAEQVPETSRHLELRTALYLVLKANFAAHATLGSEQFVYWDPTSPSECLAPDAFLRLGVPHTPFDSWKVWERGAPEVAVEILSASDARDRSWEEKLRKYHRLGVQELVRFDPEDTGAPLRSWSFRQGDCVEQVLESSRAGWSALLGAFWVVVEDAVLGPMLRLSRDREGTDLLPTPEEIERTGKQAEREAKEAERAARRAAELRVRELEEELARRGG